MNAIERQIDSYLRGQEADEAWEEFVDGFMDKAYEDGMEEGGIEHYHAAEQLAHRQIEAWEEPDY